MPFSGRVGIMTLADRAGTSLDEHQTLIDNPVKVYLAEVRKVPPLSRDEEIRCLRHVRAGDQRAESAGKRLVEANLHLVVSIAQRYRSDRFHFFARSCSDRGGDSFSA